MMSAVTYVDYRVDGNVCAWDLQHKNAQSFAVKSHMIVTSK